MWQLSTVMVVIASNKDTNLGRYCLWPFEKKVVLRALCHFKGPWTIMAQICVFD